MLEQTQETQVVAQSAYVDFAIGVVHPVVVVAVTGFEGAFGTFQSAVVVALQAVIASGVVIVKAVVVGGRSEDGFKPLVGLIGTPQIIEGKTSQRFYVTVTVAFNIKRLFVEIFWLRQVDS